MWGGDPTNLHTNTNISVKPPTNMEKGDAMVNSSNVDNHEEKVSTMPRKTNMDMKLNTTITKPEDWNGQHGAIITNTTTITPTSLPQNTLPSPIPQSLPLFSLPQPQNLQTPSALPQSQPIPPPQTTSYTSNTYPKKPHHTIQSVAPLPQQMQQRIVPKLKIPLPLIHPIATNQVKKSTTKVQRKVSTKVQRKVSKKLKSCKRSTLQPITKFFKSTPTTPPCKSTNTTKTDEFAPANTTTATNPTHNNTKALVYHHTTINTSHNKVKPFSFLSSVCSSNSQSAEVPPVEAKTCPTIQNNARSPRFEYSPQCEIFLDLSPNLQQSMGCFDEPGLELISLKKMEDRKEMSDVQLQIDCLGMTRPLKRTCN